MKGKDGEKLKRKGDKDKRSECMRRSEVTLGKKEEEEQRERKREKRIEEMKKSERQIEKKDGGRKGRREVGKENVKNGGIGERMRERKIGVKEKERTRMKRRK